MATAFDRLTRTPANVADWRIQRAKDSTRGRIAPEAVPGPRDFSEDWQDNLRPSRAIVGWSVACIAGWALFIWSVFPK